MHEVQTSGIFPDYLSSWRALQSANFQSLKLEMLSKFRFLFIDQAFLDISIQRFRRSKFNLFPQRQAVTPRFEMILYTLIFRSVYVSRTLFHGGVNCQGAFSIQITFKGLLDCRNHACMHESWPQGPHKADCRTSQRVLPMNEAPFLITPLILSSLNLYKSYRIKNNMPESFGLETVKETIIAVQAEIDDNDDKTIRFSTEPAMHGAIFNGFTDFDLDLSCLSPPSSPTPSTSNLPPDTPSPPSSPILSRSTSFISQMSPLPNKKSKKRISSPHLAAAGPATTSRGSWPLIKYAGRGTPIDRNRRLEWGGFSGEEVAEDGILFSNVRSTSLNSGMRPSQCSTSPEWSHISALSLHSHTASSESASRGDGSIHEQPPELAPILIEGLGGDKSDEWDSIMKTVLGPSSAETPPTSNRTEASTVQQELEVHPKRRSVATVESRFMSPEQIEQLNNGLEIDLGLNAALDLGLGRRGGMNWFDLGLLPKSANGHETPSVYSSRAPTPRAESPPPSMRASEHRSTTSTKAGGNGDIMTKTESHPWWRRILLRLRRVQSLITVHKSRF